MDDMDLDDLLGNPTKARSRPSRFAPKGSKPKPKTEPTQPLPPSASEPSVKTEYATKKEDVGVKLEMKPEYANNIIDTDVQVKPDVKEEGGDDLMDIDASGVEVEPEDELVRELDVYFTPSIDPQTQVSGQFVFLSVFLLMEFE